MSSTQPFSEAYDATQQAAAHEELFAHSLTSLFKGPAIKVRIELDPNGASQRHPENSLALNNTVMGLSSKEAIARAILES